MRDARWYSHSKFCYSKKLHRGVQDPLNFIDVDLKRFRTLSKQTQGGQPVFKSLIFYNPLKEEQEFVMDSACIIYIPRNFGVDTTVTSGEETVRVRSSNFYGLLVMVPEGVTMSLKTTRASSTNRYIIFLYNERVDSPALKEF